MNNDRYNNVGSIEKASSTEVKYVPGPEGLAFYKSSGNLLNEHRKSRRLCYIPAAAFKKDKHGNKYFIDKIKEPKPALGYSALDLFNICGRDTVSTILLFKLLNGAIPERLYKAIIKEGLIEVNPAYMLSENPDMTDIYCKRSHPWIFKAIDIGYLRDRTVYTIDHYWYKNPDRLLNFNTEWASSIYNGMYSAWYFIGDKYFNKVPKDDYTTWGWQLLQSEIGERNIFRVLESQEEEDEEDEDD